MYVYSAFFLQPLALEYFFIYGCQEYVETTFPQPHLVHGVHEFIVAAAYNKYIVT